MTSPAGNTEPTADPVRDLLLLATAREVINCVLANYTAAEDDVRRTEESIVRVLNEVCAFPDVAAAVTAERDKYLRVADAIDEQMAKNDFALVSGEHIARRIREAS